MFVLETGSLHVAQTYLKFVILPICHRYWEYKCVPPCPTKLDFLTDMFNKILPLGTS